MRRGLTATDLAGRLTIVISAISLTGLVATVTVNAVIRRASIAFVESFDLLQFLLALALAAAMSYTRISGGHIRVDFVVNRLVGRAHDPTKLFISFVVLVICIGATWAMVYGSMYAFRVNQHYETLGWPIFIPKALLAFCFLSFAVLEALDIRTFIKRLKSDTKTLRKGDA